MQIRVVVGPAGPGRCAFCHDAAPPPGQAITCSACKVVLHPECHGLLLRCPTRGCGAGPGQFEGARVYLIGERWQVLGVTGRERYGTSVHALDRKLGRDVSLLYLDLGLRPGEPERILSPLVEADEPFPGSVPLLDWGVDPRGDRAFLVREFVAGGESLARLLERRKRLDASEVTWLARSLLGPLAILHERGVAYGEVPCGDALLLERGQDQVCLRLASRGLSSLQGLLSSSAFVERVAYVPVDREPPISAELFAVGVLLYRALSGHLPWSVAGGTLHVLAARAGPPARLQGDDPLTRAIMQAITDRFASARELLENLTGY